MITKSLQLVGFFHPFVSAIERGIPVKQRLALLLIILQGCLSAYGQMSNDTLFIYNNILEKDNSLTLDNHKVIIEKAIAYSKNHELIYEELLCSRRLVVCGLLGTSNYFINKCI